jgi:hypothetical protein
MLNPVDLPGRQQALGGPILANRPYVVPPSKHGSNGPSTTAPVWKKASVGQFGAADPDIP